MVRIGGAYFIQKSCWGTWTASAVFHWDICLHLYQPLHNGFYSNYLDIRSWSVSQLVFCQKNQRNLMWGHSVCSVLEFTLWRINLGRSAILPVFIQLSFCAVCQWVICFLLHIHQFMCTAISHPFRWQTVLAFSQLQNLRIFHSKVSSHMLLGMIILKLKHHSIFISENEYYRYILLSLFLLWLRYRQILYSGFFVTLNNLQTLNLNHKL